ncbi:MAG: phage holin family protein [Betaproteobacteria bacterium]|nr:phage holin family protein [Betaproteobacteria bacterium]MDE2123707.1 phage holin family protein [Betaproteobacteria bacterium]MDE2187637.1 phage holin family protein [Betaproteobacteria bacterium]MDE2324164.1 phage holin family protein [Betaproteobacteria bacterium]
MADHPDAGWTGSLRARLDNLLTAAQTRLELLTVELQEEKLRLARLLFMTVLAALFLGFAAVFAALWITVALWDSHRLLALGLATGLFVTLGVAAATVAARTVAAGSRLFAASINELNKDRSALRREP